MLIKIFPFQVTLLFFLMVLLWVLCLMVKIQPEGILISLSALLISLGISYSLFKEWQLPFKSSIVFILLTFVSGSIMMFFHDFSYDGQLYHQEAIHLIKTGWNFIYNANLSMENLSYAIVYYPKAIWILNAVFYDISSNLEFSKCVSVIFIFSAFFLFLDFADTYLLKYKYIFAAVLALNPIVLGEFFTFYVDGMVSLLFLQAILNFLIYLKTNKMQYLIGGLINSILLANCKFSSLAFSILILFFLGLFMIISRRETLRKIYWMAIPFILVFGLVSINPYITNTIYKGSPLYPIISKDGFDKIQTMQSQASDDFNKKDRFTRFFYSLFGKTSSLIKGIPPLKIPFTVSLSEFTSYTNPCPRSGGFGPLFGGMVLIISAIFIYQWKKVLDKKNMMYFLFTMLALVFVNSESWWARLSPHFYFIIVSLLIILVLYNLLSTKIIYFSFFILILNSLFVFSAAFLIEVLSEIKLARQVEILRSENIGKLKVDFCPFVEFDKVRIKEYTASNKIRIQEYGFSYDEVMDHHCKNYTSSLYSNARLCLEDFNPSLQKKLEDEKKLSFKDGLVQILKRK